MASTHWVLRLPNHREAIGTDRVVGAKPEIEGTVGAEELLWVILAAVSSDHVSRGAVPVVDLKEVVVAVGAALQMKERKGDTHNLVRVDADSPVTADQVFVLIVTWGVGITEGTARTRQVTSTHLLWALAEWAGPLGGASTCESVDAVGAGSSILTGAA